MKEDFVMRGQTASGFTETLNFGGHKDGYGFRLVEFKLWPSMNVGGKQMELHGSITAAKTFEDPINPNYNNEGLIGTSMFTASYDVNYGPNYASLVNDTFLITQNLIIAVIDTFTGSPSAVNWQCRFRPVKLDTAKQALTNYRQFMIFDE